MNKTFIGTKEQFHGITKAVVEWLLKHCQTCLQNRQNHSRAPPEPIILNHRMQRIQIDLVDMRHEPDGQYKWILHIKDHFSKWSPLFPLKSKSAEEVAGLITTWIGCYGVPEILQCDNGREFKGVLLVLLKRHGIKVKNGRPRTPQTQGLVEQANGTMKTKLCAWKVDTTAAGGNSHCWTQALRKISLAMNRQGHLSLDGRSPYEVMFNRKPRWEPAISIAARAEQTISDIPEELDPSTESQNNTTSSINLDPDLDNLSEALVIAVTSPQSGWQFENEEDRPDNGPSTNTITEVIEGQLTQANAQSVEISTPEGEDDQPRDTESHQESTLVEQTELEQALQPAAAKARERSHRKYNGQHVVERFIAGDNVTLKIPREDRAATDPTRITCRVLAESYPNHYKLQTKYGVLSNHFPVSQLLRVPNSTSTQISIPSAPMSTVISLHPASCPLGIDTPLFREHYYQLL